MTIESTLASATSSSHRIMTSALPWMALVFALSVNAVHAQEEERVLLAPERWLGSVFGDAVPAPQVLWLTGDLKQRAADILGHPYPGLRLRYWKSPDTSAWILEEIGKTQPITAGFAVGRHGIRDVDVLVYRESRGDEVRHAFFTDQFTGANLDPDHQLDRRIDGITGATLSVDALTRLSRLALLLDGQVRGAHPAGAAAGN